MKSDFLLAVTQLAAERRLPHNVVLSAVEAALVSAFKKEGAGASENVSVRIMPTTGDILVFVGKVVVESVIDPANELTLEEGRAIRADAQLGQTVEIEETPREAGRIAAQTAKQVVMQRLREAERDIVYDEYAGRVNEVIAGVVQKLEPGQVIINLGRTEAILPASELVPTEHYRPGQRMRVLVREVERGQKGPRIIVSRAHRDLIRRLFELEVPEIANGIVVIRSIAREPGYRTKVAVEARQPSVDPVGSCVGLRGVRIQNIVNELHGEKIDVIPWNADPIAFISQALSPAQVTRVDILDAKTALVIVPDGQLSLAIGREGQNARLAAKLTGWRIDIRSNSEVLTQEGERTARGPEQVLLERAAEAESLEAETTVADVPATPTTLAPAATVSAVVAPAAQVPTQAPAAVAPPVVTPAAVTPIAAGTASQATTAIPTQATPAQTPKKAEPEEDIEAALRALEEAEAAEAAALVKPAETEEEPEEDEQRFDFDAWLQQYQTQDNSGQIRFAEDIFPERGRRAPGTNRDERRKGASGGNRRGGSR